MYKFFRLFLVILIAYTSSANAIVEARVAVIDIQYLMEHADAYINARGKIDKISADLHNKMASKEANLKKEEETLINKRGVINDEKLQQEIEKFNKKVSGIQHKIQQKKAMIEQSHSDAVMKIQKNINQIIQSLAQNNNFNIAIPSSQILFAAPDLDITDQVLQRLNKILPSVDVDIDSIASKE